MNASINATPAASQASTICCASAEVIANGFSHRTCFPAAAACSVQTPWRWFGSGM